MEKTAGELLTDELFYTKKHASEIMTEEEIAAADEFCEDYKAFIDAGKTERECVAAAVEKLEANGFVPFCPNEKYGFGDKVYFNNRGKAIMAAVMGKRPLSDGVYIMASHIDSPRIDLKQVPLYEDNELAYFKTHYYGGIKKYQWATIPLSLHGVIVKRDGTAVSVRIGEDENDPVFVITDLLPHLAQDQMKRSAPEVIRGEELNILIGSRPFLDDKASNKVKLNIMRLLNEKYGIVESDFLSAELELVPAHKAKDVGFDRSMIGAYGHDDRVCSYPALMAAIDCDAPEHTVLAVLTDKEETGSDGNTGLNSSYMFDFIADLAAPHCIPLRTVLGKSKCLSADVNAGFDPTFPEVLEKNNAAYLNYGVCLTKFTGSRGKGGTSDASAEFVGEVRSILDKANVIWQTAELGRVDLGGGGTVAKYIANHNVDVVDMGVPVLSMHAPFEVVAKSDVYMAYKAFLAFCNNK